MFSPAYLKMYKLVCSNFKRPVKKCYVLILIASMSISKYMFILQSVNGEQTLLLRGPESKIPPSKYNFQQYKLFINTKAYINSLQAYSITSISWKHIRAISKISKSLSI